MGLARYWTLDTLDLEPCDNSAKKKKIRASLLHKIIQLMSGRDRIFFSFLFFSFFLSFFFFFFLGLHPQHLGSQARGQIEAAAASLHHSHSHTGSEPCLQPLPQLKATSDP